jgi:hypothetical protein
MVGGRSRWLALLVVVSAIAAACSTPAAAAPTEPAVTVEEIEGSELERLTLSESAAERLGVETSPVRAASGAVAGRTVVPYSAVIYDASGASWAYENVEGLTFVRHPLTVESVVDGEAFLSDGPAIDASVVTVGAAELYGVETGVGGGH